MLKNVLFALIALAIFTQGLILIHNSSFEKKEYDTICNSLYDTKIMIDLCHLPYNQEIKTYQLIRNVEITGIAVFSLTFLFFQSHRQIAK